MKENKIAGVYKITNTITGEFYIGSSKNIKYRWATHKCLSMWKQHPNSKLYKDMASYGLDNFTFEIIEKTGNLKEREQYWVDQLKPSYNVRRAKREIEDFEEAHKQRSKAWYKFNRNERLAYSKAYKCIHREELLTKSKDYCSRLCLYNGETLTLRALSSRFRRQGILHPTLKAKEYLL